MGADTGGRFMKIRILCVGHLKEAYWKAAETEYLKRLSPYAQVSVEEVDDLPSKENASLAMEEEVKSKEGSKILAKLKPNDFVCTLDLDKEEPDSVGLANKMMTMFTRGGSTICFVIGGSLGLSQELKKRANASLSLSHLTFTHQMTRIILLEQLYRSFKILNHEPYHK
jgi:23S rRNA (pseudouridine1915-N3)-methyltransferase